MTEQHQYGPKGHIVDAFINHLRSMTQDDWHKFYAAWDAAGSAAGSAAWDAAWDVVWDAARSAGWDAGWDAGWEAAGSAAGYVAWEIQGADLMRERGQPFFFLPMFGFADEHEVIAALQPKEEDQ